MSSEISLEELSARMLAGLMANKGVVTSATHTRHYQVLLARFAIDIAEILHEELAIVQNAKDMEEMEHPSYEQCKGTNP